MKHGHADVWDDPAESDGHSESGFSVSGESEVSDVPVEKLREEEGIPPEPEPSVLHYVLINEEGLSFHIETEDPMGSLYKAKDGLKYGRYETAIWHMPWALLLEGDWNSLEVPEDIVKFVSAPWKADEGHPSDEHTAPKHESARKGLVTLPEGHPRGTQVKLTEANFQPWVGAIRWKREYTYSLAYKTARLTIKFNHAAHDMSFSLSEAKLALRKQWLRQFGGEAENCTTIVKSERREIIGADGATNSGRDVRETLSLRGSARISNLASTRCASSTAICSTQWP